MIATLSMMKQKGRRPSMEQKFGYGNICKYLLSKGWKLQRFPCVLKEDDHGVVDPHIEDKLSPEEEVSNLKFQNEIWNSVLISIKYDI